MSQDKLQTTINQLSLVMNVAEDIAAACKKAEIHPDLAKVLIQMHTSQQEIEKEINALRGNMLELARTLGTGAELHVQHMRIIEAMAKRQGFGVDELFGPQGQEEGQ